MPIPAPDLAILTAQRTNMLAAKAAMTAMVSACDAMSALQTTETARLACDRTKAGVQGALAHLVATHAAAGEDIIRRYGADGEAFVVMGAGGRR